MRQTYCHLLYNIEKNYQPFSFVTHHCREGDIYDLITFILNVGIPNNISNLTERIRYSSCALAPVISPMSIMFSIFQPNSVNSVFVLVFALSSLAEINKEWSPLFNCFG